jgi:hypothetical protein
MGRYSYDGGVCRSLASGPVPEDLNRTAFYGYSVLKMGTKGSRIARDSLAFDMVRRRPDTSPIILSFLFFSCFRGQTALLLVCEAVEKRRE